MSVESARDVLVRHLDVRCGALRKGDRTFHDTFDGRLFAAGVSLVHEDGEWALVEMQSGWVRARLHAPAPTPPLFAHDLEGGALRESVLPITDVRALLPLARLQVAERTVAVLDSEGKTVVRGSLIKAVLLEPTTGDRVLRPRLALSAVRGYDNELRRIRQALAHELGFQPAGRPLFVEAVSAAGGTPGGIASKVEVSLSYEQRADAAVVAVLRRLVEVIEANLEGTIADIDPEFLHDLRVSIRRSRSVQDELRGVFPPRELAHFRGEFRWLAQITGEARDLDVSVTEFDAYRLMLPEATRPDLDPLLELLRIRRMTARDEMVRALTGERAAALFREWSTFLSVLETISDEEQREAARPIGELTGERIRKLYERLLRMGGAIDQSSPAEEYHDLRKKGKELRYLLDLFAAPLYPSQVVAEMLKALKGMQDTLGRHQDRDLQAAMLTALSDDVAGLRGGPRALMAMGMLVGRLCEDALSARREFAERFGAFASKGQRQLVKQTFG
ncbi:MAG TPA: CHAD domain-containing protein [Solirubrobacteraceae bacterium]